MARSILAFIVMTLLTTLLPATPAQAALSATSGPPVVCAPAEQLRLSAQIATTRSLDVTVTNTSPITSTPATLVMWAIAAGERVYDSSVDVPPLSPGESFMFRAEIGIYLPAGAVQAWWRWNAPNCPSRYMTYWRLFLPVFVETSRQQGA